jgi:hypothetical protein
MWSSNHGVNRIGWAIPHGVAHLVEDEEEGWSIWLNRLKNCIVYAFF